MVVVVAVMVVVMVAMVVVVVVGTYSSNVGCWCQSVVGRWYIGGSW